MASAPNGTHLNGTNGHRDNENPGQHDGDSNIGEHDDGNAGEYYGDNAGEYYDDNSANTHGETNGDGTAEYYGTDPPNINDHNNGDDNVDYYGTDALGTNGLTNGDDTGEHNGGNAAIDAMNRNGDRNSDFGEGPISPRSAGIESTYDPFDGPMPSPGRPIIASPVYLMRPSPAEVVTNRLNELINRATRTTSAPAGATAQAGSSAQDASSAQADVAERRLRRIQELIYSVNELTVARDAGTEMLRRRQLRIDYLERQISSLQRQNRSQRLQYMESVSRLNLERATLTRQLEQRAAEDSELRAKDYNDGINDGMRAQGSPTERTVLIQQVEASRQEAERWRVAAMRAGGEAISTVWQGSVDEAVRRERERDAVIFTSWRAEINSLREARNNAEARAERAEHALRAREDEEAQ